MATRLTAGQLHELTLEYMQWHHQTDNIAVKYLTGARHVQLFIHYLAREGYYHQVRRAEGMSESSAMLYLHTAAFFQHIASR